MIKKSLFILILVLLFPLQRSEGSTIKVLILDNVFRNIPDRDHTLQLVGRLKGNLLVDGSHYPGKLEVYEDGTRTYLINELPLEEYVRNVVSAEVGPNWDLEALKVQAVIARTYAIYQKLMHGNTSYDITSSVLDQVYRGKVTDAMISEAVAQTRGEVLTYDGRPIEAFYHSTCGGETEDPREVFGKSYPYLRPVKSKCDLSPYSSWVRKIPLAEIGKALGVSGVKDIRIQSYTSTGRVRTLRVSHNKEALTVKATDLRKMLGWKTLPSTKFTFARKGKVIVFKGKGYGHGVGLCQWGALEMARAGRNYRQILAFYYPGTVIQMYEDR